MLAKILLQFIRQQRKYLFYSLINIGGLAVGIAAFLLIALFVLHESDYDTEFTNANRIVQTTLRGQSGDQPEIRLHTASIPMGPGIANEVSGIEKFLRLFTIRNELVLRAGDKSFSVLNVTFLDSTFFHFFDYPLLAGDPRTMLTAPNSFVLSDVAAKKYFGDVNVVGREIVFPAWNLSGTVTGIFKQSKYPTHLPEIHVLGSWTSLGRRDDIDWGGNFLYPTYFLLDKNVDYQNLVPLVNTYTLDHLRDFIAATGSTCQIGLRPLRSIHLDPTFESSIMGQTNNSRLMVSLFGLVGIFVLVIAILNYINLSTSRATIRARSVGISKTLGASRGHLVSKFMIESIIVSFISTTLAILIVLLLLKDVSNIMKMNLDVYFLTNTHQIVLILLFSLVIGAIAGVYPAFVLSRFKPVSMLHRGQASGRAGSKLRSLLVVLQFSISILLIIGTVVVIRQVHYLFTADLGFCKKQMIEVRLPNWDLMSKHQVFQDEMMKVSGVLESTSADYPPYSVGSDLFHHVPGMPEDQKVLLNVYPVDFDFIPTFEIKIVEGRNFQSGMSTDSVEAIILNETAVKQLGIENPVGTFIERPAMGESFAYQRKQIVGIVKDFHFQSLHNEIRPLAIEPLRGQPVYVFFKLQADRIPEVLATMKSVWKDFASDMPLDYKFVDEGFDSMYSTELRLTKMLDFFSILAISIACLGLLALAMFAVEQRRKEIAIRKVLGASSETLAIMIIREYLILTSIAFIVTIPVALYLLRSWLDQFAYKVEMTLGPFVIAYLAAILLAFLTTGSQALWAANNNPVSELRNE